MNTLEITCPHCNTSALVSHEDLGYTIDCPACGESFEAPRMAKRSVQSEPKEVIPTAEAEKSQAMIEPDKSEKTTSLAESSHGQNAMNTSLFVEEKKAVSDDASPISDSRTGEIGPPKKVAGLDDVLGRQKARGPKKDKWADFEEPTKGRKMSCWRCGYQGKTDKSIEVMGGFRKVTCPRCGARGTNPLSVISRVLLRLGVAVFFLLSVFALKGAFQNLQRDSTGAMTLGGLAGAAIPITLFVLCATRLAKDRAIRNVKKSWHR